MFPKRPIFTPFFKTILIIPPALAASYLAEGVLITSMCCMLPGGRLCSNVDTSWLLVTPETATTPAILTVKVDPTGLTPAVYYATITLVAPGAVNSPQIVEVTLTINPSGEELYNFDYPDRDSLIAEGWDFLAISPSGDYRNTEQITGTVISYDQTLHPGVISIPCDIGDLWRNLNKSDCCILHII